MKLGSKILLTGFVICVVFPVEKCYSQVIVNGTAGDHEIQNNTPFTTTCNLEDETEAYCIPIHNCLMLLDVLNATALRARKCGSAGENRSNPFVCCEKYYIKFDSNLTLVTSVRPPRPKTETVTVPPPSISSTRSPQQYPIEPSKTVERPTLVDEKVESEVLFQGCGFQEINTRILGGKPSSKKEFPWLARLLRRDHRGDIIFSCTGALITPKVVLTTAHCLVSDYLLKVGDLYAVSLGEHETECNSELDECLLNKKTVMVSKYIAHPQYNGTSKNHDNDIGLIILRKEVSFSSHISPICLLERSIEATGYHVAGWGRTESDSVSGVKLKAELPSFSWEQCAKKYRSINIELTPRQICAGGVEGKDSCQGDSGGPLMVENNMKWYVAGVVSFGLGCGRQGWPAIYAYVPSYIDWIKENIKQNTT